MNAANGAFKPKGLDGRGSRWDFFRVAAKTFWRRGDGLDGKGVSQYGQRVLGSTRGEMLTRNVYK
jgi:hypothetical protein